MMRCALAFSVLVAAAGCGDDGSAAPIDGSSADGAADGGSTDAGPLPECEFPAPRLGDSAEAQALAASPARCGQPVHQWLDDERLGDVVMRERINRIPKSLLEAALEDGGVTLPRPLAHDVAIDLVLYVTQERGRLIEATAAVAYPASGLEGDEPRDVVMMLHGTTGFSDACAPSTTLEGQALAALFASLGYVTVAPDYIGLKATGEPSELIHPYLVGQATAMASLDSVRAVGKLTREDRGGLCVAPRVLVFGGSQGGHATLWVDLLSDTYAPELELLGGMASVPPADLLGQVQRGLQTEVPATDNSTAFLGAASEWYGYGDRLDEVFREPYDVDVPAALRASCMEDAPPVPDLVLEELFQPAILDAAASGTLADVEPWGCLVAENGLTTTSIERTRTDPASYGILMTFGSDDDLVHTPIEREAFRELCEDGWPVTMIECEGADHGGGTIWAIPEILEFMEARAAGEPFVQPVCDPPAPVVCRGTP